MFDIYVRKDLNMRKGKMCAQVSHAILYNLFSLIDVDDKAMFGKIHTAVIKDVFTDWFDLGMRINVHWVDSEAELSKKFDEHKRQQTICHMVTDLGFTEFKNKKTKTCFFVMHKSSRYIQNGLKISTLMKISKNVDSKHWLNNLPKDDIKQVIVLRSKEKTKKEDLITNVMRNVIQMAFLSFTLKGDYFLMNLFEEKKTIHWILSNQKKIVLSCDQYDDFKTTVTSKYNNVFSTSERRWNTSSNPSMIVFPCQYSKDIDQLTQFMSLA